MATNHYVEIIPSNPEYANKWMVICVLSIRFANDPNKPDSEKAQSWLWLIDQFFKLNHPLSHDLRPLWREITQCPSKTEILQTLKELPNEKTIERAKTDYQKVELDRTIEMFRNIHLSILESEIKSHFKGEWSLLPNLSPKLRVHYDRLVQLFLCFYEMVRYGGSYIIQYAEAVLEAVKQQIASTTDVKQLGELAGWRVFLESFLQEFNNPQMPLKILRAVIIESSDFMTGPLFGEGYSFSPSKHKRAKKLEEKARESNCKPHLQEEYLELLLTLHKPFNKYNRVRVLCCAACEHFAPTDRALQNRWEDYEDLTETLDLTWVQPHLHPRHARAYKVSKGERL